LTLHITLGVKSDHSVFQASGSKGFGPDGQPLSWTSSFGSIEGTAAGGADWGDGKGKVRGKAKQRLGIGGQEWDGGASGKAGTLKYSEYYFF
jgi:hypothetical protein